MNWDAIAAIGQMLGSIAVFVTLGYLAVQVRHTRDEMRRSVFQSRQEAIRELCLSRANNERYQTSTLAVGSALGGSPHPFIKALIERTGVSAEGAATIMWDEHAWWYVRMQQIPYVKELPPGERAAFEKGIRGNYSTVRAWWAACGGNTTKNGSTLTPSATSTTCSRSRDDSLTPLTVLPCSHLHRRGTI